MSVPMRWQEPEIIEEPLFAPHVPLRRRATRRLNGLRATLAFGAACLTMSACTALGFQIGKANAANTPTLRMVSLPAANGQVALTNAALERKLGFVTVTGGVFSRAKHNLSQVEAVVELLDSQNRTLQVQSALVALDPLAVGQSAPFRVEMNDNPRAAGWRVHFRQMFGASLD